MGGALRLAVTRDLVAQNVYSANLYFNDLAGLEILLESINLSRASDNKRCN
jgi:methyl coenzyme M reductase beta subunit